MIPVSSCSCLCPIHWSQMLSREWRCSWSSTDSRCPNYIWLIDNLIAYQGAAYIRDLAVCSITLQWICPRQAHLSPYNKTGTMGLGIYTELIWNYETYNLLIWKDNDDFFVDYLWTFLMILISLLSLNNTGLHLSTLDFLIVMWTMTMVIVVFQKCAIIIKLHQWVWSPFLLTGIS